MSKTTAQNYELTFILGEEATSEQATSKLAEIKEIITRFEGTSTKEELWGRRELAYPIKRNRSGQYVTVWFDFPGENLKKLDELIRFDESIIRSLITKAYTEAQPGSLYPVVEEAAEKPSRKGTEETATAEEMLRRTSTKATKKAVESSEDDDLPEEERMKKLDESLDALLSDSNDEETK